MDSEHNTRINPAQEQDGNVLLRLAGASLRLGGRELLRGVSLDVARGAHLGVVGPGGSGKTLFLRLLGGELWPRDPATRRCVQADGSLGASPIFLRQRAVLVSAETAEAYRQLTPSQTALESVISGRGDGLYAYGSYSEQEERRAAELLDELGGGHLRERPMEGLSEGQLRLVLLARSLMRPSLELLLLDEMTDGLDAATRERVRRVLQRAGRRVTLVMAGHRRDDLPPLACRVLYMCGGQLREAPPEVLPGELPLPLPQPCPRPRGGDEILAVRRATVLRAGRTVLNNVSFAVRQGQGWAVTGPNGAGKSTLLKLLTGELYPVPGAVVRRLGRDAASGGVSLWEFRRRVGLAGEELQAALDPRLCVETAVATGPSGEMAAHALPPGALGKEPLARARSLLARYGIADLAGRPLAELSFGRRRLVVLLRALCGNREAFVLDEPLSGLDARVRKLFLQDLTERWADGAAVVLVTHRDEDILPGMRRLVVENGSLREE